MKLIELQIKNLGCIDEKGVTIKIDNIVVLIGPNNVGKTTVLKAYELFRSSGAAQTIDDFYQNNENNPIEIAGIFNEINDEDKTQIGEKWIYLNDDNEEVIKYKWVWNKSGEKGKKYSWNNEEEKWVLGGMGGWDTKIASCIPLPLKISPFDDSEQLEKQIVEILTSAVKDNVKNNQSKVATMIKQINDLAKDVKNEISEELDKTTNKLQKNLSDIFPEHTVDIEPQVGKLDVDKILATGTHLQVSNADGKFYPLANQGSGLQRAFLWSAIEALADSGKMKSGRTSIKNEEPKILLVEEPESFLHPPAIRSAREALYKIAELENWQVMITTHSPIFIDVSKPHTTIIRVEKNVENATKIFSTEKANFSDDERERLQMIRNCHPTINEFFFASKIILVEGDTEQVALTQVKREDTTILNCRGKANIPMFEKILNHFGMNYIVIHDLDSPKAKKKDKWIKNSMWTINEKIFLEAEKGKNNQVIVSIPDFEGQFFGYLQSGDKPYNAICELKKEENKAICEELKRIAGGEVEETFERMIRDVSEYKKLGIKYCENNGLKMEEKWDFNDC
jgi:Predicted ATP-dependent endonuclease of the OLD family